MSTNSEKEKLINDACEAIKLMAPGTMLTHLALAEILGERVKTAGYYSMVTRLKKQLRHKCSIFLSCTNRVGYLIATPGTEIDVADMQCERGIRQYVSGVKQMQYIAVDKITDEPLKQRTIKKSQDRANIIGLLKAGGGAYVQREVIG